MQPTSGNSTVAAPNAQLLALRDVDPDAIKVPAGSTTAEGVMTVLEASQLYEDVTGKRVILGAALNQNEVFFVQRGPLTNAEVAELLKISLLNDGIAILPDNLDPDRVRMAAADPVSSASQVPKNYIDSPFDLPEADQVITYKMTFQHLKPEDAQQIFQSVFGQLGSTGSITQVPNAASLVIVANSARIREMIRLQADIDVASVTGSKWIEVTYADVEEMAERLNEIYNNQDSDATTRRTGQNSRNNRGGSASPVPPSGGGNGGIAGTGGAGEDIPITIIPDRRTSRILITGRPADLVGVEATVRSFDVASSGKNRETFRLRFLRVNDFIQIAQQAIEVTLSDSASSGSGGNIGSGRQNLSNRTNNRQSANRNSFGGNNGAGGGQGAGGGGAGGRAAVNEQEVPTEPVAVSVGASLLVANNVANTVTIAGPPHHIQIIRELIGDLDTESQQVALSAVVGSYGLTDGLDFGVELAQALSRTGNDFAGGGRASFGIPSVIDPNTLSTLAAVIGDGATAGIGGGAGVSLFGLIGDDLGVFVNTLETETRFKTLERTVLVTRNNRVANFSSGQRIAIPSNSFTGGAANGTNTNFEFRDVTLELQIQPLINADNQITLEISLVRDTLGLERTVSAGIEIPDINTEQLTTSVTVENGSAVILGGIITETNNDSQSGIPILRELPGIGRLFGNTSSSGDRQELIIMIQPRIIPTSSQLEQFSSQFETDSVNTRAVRDFLPSATGVLPTATAFNSDHNPKGGVWQKPAAKKSKRKAWKNATKVQEPSKANGNKYLERRKSSKIRSRRRR